MHPLLTFSYWFSVRPVPFQPVVERGLLIFFACMAIVGIAAYAIPFKRAFSKPLKRTVNRAASLLAWIGLVGLLLWAFSYEDIPVLSMRAFYLPLVIWFVWGVWGIVHYLRVTVPKNEQMYHESIESRKWLPKKKK